MDFFVEKLIKPFILERGYRKICEIGSKMGKNVDTLLKAGPVEFSIIDPCLDKDLEKKYAANKSVKVYKGFSLDILPDIKDKFDCIMIDGDHNWYTVYNELCIIEKNKLLNDGGAILFQDVCWPYARRDLYYIPENIPAEYRHPYSTGGMIKGQSALVSSGGKNSGLYNAVYEGGERNGVLTAVEDFLKENQGKYLFFKSRAQFGLGILIKRSRLADDIFLAAQLFLKIQKHDARYFLRKKLKPLIS